MAFEVLEFWSFGVLEFWSLEFNSQIAINGSVFVEDAATIDNSETGSTKSISKLNLRPFFNFLVPPIRALSLISHRALDCKVSSQSMI